MVDKEVREKVICLLKGMKNGEINLILGCLELDAFWHQGHDFIGADFGEHYSSLAHLPLPAQYHLWNEQALMIKVQELDNYKPIIMFTIELLLKKLTITNRS